LHNIDPKIQPYIDLEEWKKFSKGRESTSTSITGHHLGN
jgi:hypothetical protein